MALPSWYDIEESDQFQKADDIQKDKYRNQYFDESVAADKSLSGRSPEEIESARAGWLERVNPRPTDQGFLGNIAEIGKESFVKVGESMRMTDDMMTGNFDEDTAGIIAGAAHRRSRQFEPEELTETKEMMSGVSKGYDEAQGFKETAGSVLDAVLSTGREVITNPKGVAYLSAESIGNVAPSLGGTLAGAGAGIAASGPIPLPHLKAAGGLIGGTIGGMSAEMAPKFEEILFDTLGKLGQQPTEQNIQALLDNKDFTGPALKRARLKGAATALTDSALNLLTGRLATAPIRVAQNAAMKKLGGDASEKAIALEVNKILAERLFKDKVMTGVKAFGTEIASEPISEAAGQLAADKKLDMGELVGETLGGIGTSAVSVPVDVAAFGSQLKKDADLLSGETPAATIDQDAPVATPVDVGQPIEAPLPLEGEIAPEVTAEPMAEEGQVVTDPPVQLRDDQVAAVIQSLEGDDFAADDPENAGFLKRVLDSPDTSEEAKVAIEKSGILEKFGVKTRMQQAASAPAEELLDPAKNVGEAEAQAPQFDAQAARAEDEQAFTAAYDAGQDVVVPEAQAQAVAEPAPAMEPTPVMASKDFRVAIAGVKKDPQAQVSTEGMSAAQQKAIGQIGAAVQRGNLKAVERLENRAINQASKEAERFSRLPKFKKGAKAFAAKEESPQVAATAPEPVAKPTEAPAAVVEPETLTASTDPNWTVKVPDGEGGYVSVTWAEVREEAKAEGLESPNPFSREDIVDFMGEGTLTESEIDTLESDFNEGYLREETDDKDVQQGDAEPDTTGGEKETAQEVVDEDGPETSGTDEVTEPGKAQEKAPEKAPEKEAEKADAEATETTEEKPEEKTPEKTEEKEPQSAAAAMASADQKEVDDFFADYEVDETADVDAAIQKDIEGLDDIEFSKEDIQKSGEVKEEAYAQALPIFVRLWNAAEKSGKDWKDILTAIVERQGKKVVPYLKRFVSEVRAGEIDPATWTKPAEAVAPKTDTNWADAYASQENGTVTFSNDEVALVKGFNDRTGTPVYFGVNKDSGFMTSAGISTYTGQAFTKKQVSKLRAEEGKDRSYRQKQSAKKENRLLEGKKIAFSENFPEKMQGVAADWKKMLKLGDTPIYFATYSDVENGDFFGDFEQINVVNTKAETTGGLMVPLISGRGYAVLLEDTAKKTQFMEVLAHELGHVYQSKVFNKASTAERKAVFEAHAEWVRTADGKSAQEFIKSMSPRAGYKRRTNVNGDGLDFPSSQMGDLAYWRSFSEYFAEQVGRWMTTDERPVSVVEKFFAKLAKAISAFFKNPKVSEFLTDQAVADFLNNNTIPFAGDTRGMTKEAMVMAMSEDLFEIVQTEGWPQQNITGYRKEMAKTLGLSSSIEKSGEFKSAVYEAIEYVVVKLTRSQLEQHNEYGAKASSTLRYLAKFYNFQPTIKALTGDAKSRQAYSTPTPLAFLVQHLAGMSQRRGQTVYEPTAGTGLLVTNADVDSSYVNELDITRAAILEDQGFRTTKEDGTTARAPEAVDVVVANPPFGKVKQYGVDKSWTIGGFKTNKIDEAIMLRSLESMRADGTGSFIVGGLNKLITEDKRAKAYGSPSRKRFFKHLYDNYNVTDHFTVGGNTYAKQGTTWPVDVIVIKGKGQSEKATPDFVAPPIYKSYDELGDKLEKIDNEGEGIFGVDATRDEQESSASTGLSGTETVKGTFGGSIPPTGSRGDTVRTDDGGRTGRAGTGDGQTTRPVSPATGSTGDQQQSGTGVDSIGEPRTDGTVTDTKGARAEDGGRGKRDDGRKDTDKLDSGTGTGNTGTNQPVIASKGQTHYDSHSKNNAIGTLVPTNMAAPIQKALGVIADKHGSIDSFVQGKLGYKTVKELHKALSAEQIDAVALIVSNADKGSGFVLGDQTGIGKGRVVASLIKYALLQGKTPVFMTETPGLYADMYRDMIDIGMDPSIADDIFMTNVNKKVMLDKDNDVELKSPAKNNAIMRDWNEKGLPAQGKSKDNKKIVFTTYYQMHGGAKEGVGNLPPRRKFMSRLMKNNDVYLIMDESHNAGGGANLYNQTPNKDTGIEPYPLGLMIRALVRDADSVLYSSATYAKNPDVMDLYAATDLILGVQGNPRALADTIKAGGVPLQSVTAAMLAEAGQYIRRERSFDGVKYTPELTPVNTDIAENVSEIMSGIRDFEDTEMVPFFDEGGASTLGSIGTVGEKSQNFTSLMHNVIDQMLLALKVKPATAQAIKVLKEGEKGNEQVVMTMANTMGSFIDSYVREFNLEIGDEIPLRFNDLLLRYLYKTRQYKIEGETDTNGKPKTFFLTDSEMPEMALSSYNSLAGKISAMNLEELPVSPVDYMHNQFREAGVKSLEITGRDYTIDYSGEVPILSRRSRADLSTNGRIDTVRKYNSGDYRAIILNTSGSTGISLHASERNPEKGRGKRTMYIVQPEKDINTHMQMLGRIHRTGQVTTPDYVQIVADVPAEKKIAAWLVAKMNSLNANTTADSDSLFTDDTAINFMNKYGDIISGMAMRSAPELNHRLGYPVNPDAKATLDGAAKRVTGRLPLLKLAEQEQVYETLQQSYTDYIAELDARGANDLVAKTYDLDAKTVVTQEVQPSSGESPFQGAVTAEHVDMKRIGRPYSSKQVAEMVKDNEGQGEEVADRANVKFDKMVDEHLTEIGNEIEEAQGIADKAKDEKIKAPALKRVKELTLKLSDKKADFKKQKREFKWWNEMFEVGNSVSADIHVDGMPPLTGMVIGKEYTGKTKNPLALSGWRVKIAVADGIRIMNMPFSRVTSDFEDKGHTYVNSIPSWSKSDNQVMEMFDKARSTSREKRWIITGNLFGGYANFTKSGGQIVNFTRNTGETSIGILMPTRFDLNEAQSSQPIAFQSADELHKYLTSVGRGMAELNRAGQLRIIRNEQNGDPTYTITTQKSEAKGGRYWKHDAELKEITGDFHEVGNRMVTDRLTKKQVTDAYNLFGQRGAQWMAHDSLGTLRDIQQVQKPEDAKLSIGEALTDAQQSNVAKELEGAGVTAKMQQALKDKGLVEIISHEEAKVLLDGGTVKDVRKSQSGTVEGFTMPDGKVYLVQGGIAKGQAKAVFMHEFGHSFLPKAFVGKSWKQVSNMFKKHAKATTKQGEAVRAAKARVPENTPDHLVEEEAIMYFLSETANEKLPLYKRILSKVKQYLVSIGVPASILTPNDIRIMVDGYISNVAGRADERSDAKKGDVRFSLGALMPKAFLDAARLATKTETFKKWFGDSKIKSNGKPHILYHGTADPKFLQDEATPWVFDTDAPVRQGSSALAGLGIFLGNDTIANAHTGGQTGTVHPFFVKVENPLVMTSAELEAKIADPDAARAFKKQMKDLKGYDGIIIKDRGHVVVFDSNQLKSASNNTGLFSAESPDVRYSVSESQQTIGNTVDLNAVLNGKKSKTSAKDGAAIIKELMRKLHATSAPVAGKKFSPAEADKVVAAFKEAQEKIGDSGVSIANKQKMAAAFATKIPAKPRAQLLRILAQVSKYKTEQGQQSHLVRFMDTAETTVARYLQSEMRKKMVELSKERKLAKNKIKQGKGAGFMRDLGHVRSMLENVKTEAQAAAESVRIFSRIERREETLANGNMTETAAKALHEKINDDYSRLNLLNIYGGLMPVKDRASKFEETLSAMENLKELVATKNKVWHQQLKAKRDSDQQNANKAIQDITGQENPTMESQGSKIERERKERSFMGRFTGSIKGLYNSIQSWELLLADFARKAGGIDSWLVNHFGSVVHHATRNEEQMNMDTHDMLDAKAKEILGVVKDKTLAKRFANMSKPVKDAVRLYDEKGTPIDSLRISQSQAGYLYQIARGSADNKAIADTMAKMGMTEQTMTEILDFMDKGTKDWADYLVDEFYQDFHYDVNDIYKVIEGVDLTKTKNYVPLKREYAGKAIEKDLESFLGYTSGKGTRKGAMKERVYNTNSFLLEDMTTVLMNHVSDMNHYKAWAMPMREVNGTFNNKEVQAYVRQHNGMSGSKVLKNFQDHFVKTAMESRVGNISWVDGMRGRLTTSLIGANPVVFLKQLSSIPAYAADIPVTEWVKYSGEAMANPLKAWKELSGESTMMRSRYRKGFERDVAQAKKKAGGQSLSKHQTLVDKSMALIALGDKMAIVGGGYAVYKYHLNMSIKEGMSTADAKKVAITEFEKSTERAQQSSNIKDLGWFQRGNSMMKLFTMFMTAPASYSRQLYLGVNELAAGGKKAQGVKRLFIYGVLLPSIFQAVADAMLSFDGDEEDEERLAKNQWKMLSLTPFNGIPVLRTLAEGYWNSVDGNGFYGEQFSPVLNIHETGKRIAVSTKKAMTGGTKKITPDEYWDRAGEGLVHLVGNLTGVPTRPLQRMGEGWFGDEDTEHPFRKRIGYSRHALGE